MSRLNQGQVEQLRQDYIDKSRSADEAEDEYAAPPPHHIIISLTHSAQCPLRLQ